MKPIEDWEVAYEAYRAHTGGISLASGQPIPAASELRPDIQEAWKASARALRRQILCDVHWNLDQADKLQPFDNCVACIRVERDELQAKVDNASRIAAEIKEMVDAKL